jgi:hypothetical protein
MDINNQDAAHAAKSDTSSATQCPLCSEWWPLEQRFRMHFPSCRKRMEQLANSPQNKLLAQFKDAAEPYTMDDYISDHNFDMNIFESYYSDNDDDDKDGGCKSDDDKSDEDSLDANNDEDAGLYSDDDTADALSTEKTTMSNPMTETQLRLNDVMNKHKCSLQLHDNVVELINGYIKSDQFCPFAKWKRRKHIMRDVENAFQTGHLKPTNGTVQVFDIKHMIINMLTDPTLMHKDNLVRGHNIFTGEMDEASEHAHVYGEIPTGDAWKPARDR